MSENYATDTTYVFADSDSFFNKLAADIQNAKRSVRIQCMSFEADLIGTKLIELLSSKPTLERTLLIDHYSRFVVNDTFLFAPAGWMNKNNARDERKELDILLKRARESGIRIKFTNPMGLMMYRYPARNHKKMVLIDENISYLGGMNFTEHNFRWTDLMVRHTQSAINTALSVSFDADLNETEVEPIIQINKDTTLYIFDGLKTKSAYQTLMEQIKSSNKIVAISPYISYPMLDAIGEIPDNKVILPKQNNKPLIKFIHSLKRYSTINYIYVSGEMLHTKLMLLDDSIAVYGSGNFDTISYFFEKEIILVNKDSRLLDQLTKIVSNLKNSN